MEKQAGDMVAMPLTPANFKASLVYTEFKTELQRSYLNKVTWETMLESMLETTTNTAIFF